ncbi:MAG: hypothetical protein PVH61_41860 [Candidatus Aminicenantes bacterium]|jgi:hypothetical protein
MIVKKITENYNGTDIIFKLDNKGFYWIDFNDFVSLTEGLYNYSTLLAWIKKHRQFRNHFYSYHNMEPGCRGITLAFNEYGIISCLLYLNTTELGDAASWVASILQSYRFPPSPAGLKNLTLLPEYKQMFWVKKSNETQNKGIMLYSDQQNQIWTPLSDICYLFGIEPESIYGYHIMNPDDYSSYLNENITGSSFDDFCGVNEYGIIAMPFLFNCSYDVVSFAIKLTRIFIRRRHLLLQENTKEVSI